jgi:hypothetical protein
MAFQSESHFFDVCTKAGAICLLPPPGPSASRLTSLRSFPGCVPEPLGSAYVSGAPLVGSPLQSRIGGSMPMRESGQRLSQRLDYFPCGG